MYFPIIDVLKENFIAKIPSIVTDWLDEHPEATTTVQDGAITYEKLNGTLKGGAYQTPYTNPTATGINWKVSFVTPEMFGAVGDGVTDDTQAFSQFLAYVDANKAVMLVPQKNYKADITLATSNKKYDFGHANIFGMLTIANGTTSLTVKNATFYFDDTKEHVALFGENVRTITFVNCEFRGCKENTEQLHYEKNTWAFKFINCAFVGGSNKAKAVINGTLTGANRTDIVANTLIFTDCHFYNFESIKYQTVEGESSISIIGGYLDEIDYVVYSASDILVSLELSGVDVESTQYLLYAVNYAFATISLASCYGTPTYIAYAKTGRLNVDISGFRFLTLVHLFPQSVLTQDSNLIFASLNGININGVCKYYVAGDFKTSEISIYVPPNEMVKALDTVYFINIDRKSDQNTDVQFYDKNGELTQAASYWYNRLSEIYVKNNSSTGKVVTFSIYGPCIINNW